MTTNPTTKPPIAGCASPALCPLTRVREGMCARVRSFSSPPDVAQRLREIGLAEDRHIRIVSSQQSVICMVCNSRLAISSELAETILVEPDPAFSVMVDPP